MTARADRLITRANIADHAGPFRTSYPASSVRVFVDGLERLDYRMEPVLADAGGCASRCAPSTVSRVGGGGTRIQAIARELAVSARTLQRRLAASGISYQRLLDVARKDAAGRYLTESPLAIGEIAYLLGYSEPAAFNRAFRRWHHETPQAFRQRRGGEHRRISASV